MTASARLMLLAVVASLAVGLHCLQAVNTPRLVEQPITLEVGANQARVNGQLTTLETEPVRISGYFKLDRTKEARMFYFYFQARTAKGDEPVVLWMTGGPGCSSELAVFFENGPFEIQPNLTTTLTEFGWDNTADMIYVDQPINTGFSYSDDPRDEVHDEKGVSNDMLDFLNELFLAHPEFQGRDFYVTGESYGGHYVPAVSSRIFKAIKTKEEWVKADINLKGFAIGNGLTDPAIQYGAYADYAYSMDLISEEVRERVLAAYPACKAAIDICNAHEWVSECLLAVQYCQATQVSSILALLDNINIYDVRKPCVGQLCYDFTLMERYLALPAVRKALGVHKKWEACNMTVYQDMLADFMRDYEPIMPEMLEAGVRVLVYAGDQDFICNHIGNKRWVANVTWPSKSEQEPHPVPWMVDGKEAGMLTDYGPLQFLRVYDAGHMVPMDQGRHALDMITKFVHNQPLVPASHAAEQGEAGQTVAAV